MRFRASVWGCLVLGVVSLVAAPASAGFALVSSGFGTGRQSFIAPIEAKPASLYTAAIDPNDFVRETPDGGWIPLTALAELGVSPAAGTLYATGSQPLSSALKLYAIGKAKNAAGVEVTIATEKQAIELGDPNAVIEGAAFDHLGRLLLLVLSPTSPSQARVVHRFDVVGAGWSTKPSFTWTLPSSVAGSGGDLTALRDGRMFIAINEGLVTKAPRYFSICRENDPLPVVRAQPTGGYCADGVVAEQQVLAVNARLDEHTVTPPDAPTEQKPAPFWTPPTTGGAFDGADLAGVVPFFDTDGDGLSDADEDACANVRSVEGVGPPDYEDADIDDDCLTDKADVVPGAANSRASRQDPKLPNANADRNCRGGSSNDGADDGAICVLAAGAQNPACVPGCRPGVVGSACPDGLDCVPAAGTATGTCQVPPRPSGGGAGGAAGRGSVGIDGQAGGGGVAPTGSGVSSGKVDDSGGCALVGGPRALERTSLAALVGLGLAALGLARRRGDRQVS